MKFTEALYIVVVATVFGAIANASPAPVPEKEVAAEDTLRVRKRLCAQEPSNN